MPKAPAFVPKFSPDQPRDESGRWAAGGSEERDQLTSLSGHVRASRIGPSAQVHAEHGWTGHSFMKHPGVAEGKWVLTGRLSAGVSHGLQSSDYQAATGKPLEQGRMAYVPVTDAVAARLDRVPVPKEPVPDSLFRSEMPDATKYSDSQPRDERGRWTSGGEGSGPEGFSAAIRDARVGDTLSIGRVGVSEGAYPIVSRTPDSVTISRHTGWGHAGIEGQLRTITATTFGSDATYHAFGDHSEGSAGYRPLPSKSEDIAAQARRNADFMRSAAKPDTTKESKVSKAEREAFKAALARSGSVRLSAPDRIAASRKG